PLLRESVPGCPELSAGSRRHAPRTSPYMRPLLPQSQCSHYKFPDRNFDKRRQLHGWDDKSSASIELPRRKSRMLTGRLYHFVGGVGEIRSSDDVDATFRQNLAALRDFGAFQPDD